MKKIIKKRILQNYRIWIQRISTDSEDIQSGNTIEGYETEGQHDGLTIQNAMLAVYNYLQEQNTLQNMAFSYTANAKGEVYAVVSETQETKER